MKLNERNLVYYATCKSPVDKCGFLYKKGERNASYHRRWFVLKGNMLFYYDGEDSKEPLGVIILEGCRVELYESTEEFAFAIKFGYAKSRAYVLAADNQSTMESWVKALSRANFEYIRLVVNELQEQLVEIKKSQRSISGTRDTTELNPSSHRDCPAVPDIQDRPFLKDNGSVPWNSPPDNVPNGVALTNGPKYKYTEGHLRDDPGESAQLYFMASEKSLQSDSSASNEEAEDTPNFSRLHDLFGKEILELRSQWAKNAYEQS
ncbi:PREDICTED: sesquipedalian-1 [Nanorana parkeri]|uniref:sesquipedalian-1 n=1 Tax=Nanorana parkeri TaxID=125878 RepID=UPI000854299E|nr:PREDICTED: sesquipedalian-1 [Nanorana parkeri]